MPVTVVAKKMILGVFLIMSVVGMMAGTFLLVSPTPQQAAQIYVQAAFSSEEDQAHSYLQMALALDPYNFQIWQMVEQQKQAITMRTSFLRTKNSAVLTP